MAGTNAGEVKSKRAMGNFRKTAGDLEGDARYYVYQYERAGRIYWGQHPSATNGGGDWDFAHKPYSPLHVYAIPVKTSDEYWQNNGSLIDPEDGDKLPVLFRVDDANLSGAGGNWIVGDPVWTMPEAKEVYFVQHYYDNPNQPNDRLKEVKLEYGDNHYAKQSLDGTISLPSNGVTYNPGYLYPRVKVFFPKPPPFNCTPPPPPNWKLTMQSSVSMSEPVIIDLVLDGDETEGAPGGTYKWYWAPDITNPQNGVGVPNLVHSNIIICGNEFGLANVDAEFMDRHLNHTSEQFVKHVHEVEGDLQLVLVDLSDPAIRQYDFSRVSGMVTSDSHNFVYRAESQGQIQPPGPVRGHAWENKKTPSSDNIDVRWSTATLGGFEVLYSVLWNYVDTPGQGGEWREANQVYSLAQSATDFLCITAHGGFGNAWGLPNSVGHGRPMSNSQSPNSVEDDAYHGSNITFMASAGKLYPDHYLHAFYDSRNISPADDPVHDYANINEPLSMLGPRQFSRFFDSTSIDYNSTYDEVKWLLINSCRTLAFTKYTKWKDFKEYIYHKNQLGFWVKGHNYYVNSLRNWRKLLSGVDDESVKGSLNGIMGWYGVNEKQTSADLIDAYKSALALPGGYDGSRWQIQYPDMHRNIALWLQKAADQTQYQNGQPGQLRVWYYYEPKKDGDRPKGIPTGLWYNQYGYFVSALDQSGDYLWLANAKNEVTAFDWVLCDMYGNIMPNINKNKQLGNGDYFKVAILKIKSNSYPSGFNYFAAWKES